MLLHGVLGGDPLRLLDMVEEVEDEGEVVPDITIPTEIAAVATTVMIEGRNENVLDPPVRHHHRNKTPPHLELPTMLGPDILLIDT